MPPRAPDPTNLTECRRAAHALLRAARSAPPEDCATYLALAAGVLRDGHPATARRLRRLANRTMPLHTVSPPHHGVASAPKSARASAPPGQSPQGGSASYSGRYAMR